MIYDTICIILGFVLLIISGVFILGAITTIAFAYVGLVNFIYRKTFKKNLIKFY